MSNIDVWPDSLNLVCRCIVEIIRSIVSSKLPRPPNSSKAPTRIRLSRVRRFNDFESTRRHMSSRSLNGPPASRTSTIGSIAEAPTFFTAASPKRMMSFPSVSVSIVKPDPE